MTERLDAVRPPSVPADRVLPLVFLFGLSDSGQELVRVRENNRPEIILSGTCSFENHLTRGRFVKKKVWLGGTPAPQRVTLPPGGLINYIADPDSHGRALDKARIVAESVARPCFNPPHLVAETRRDQIAKRLASIPGLRMPRTIRITPAHPRDFLAAVARHELGYPIIVRLAGDHGGVSTVRVDDAGGWDAIYQLPWGGRAVYLTEYVDYRDTDGLFRKHRIAMVRGRPLLRHVIIGSAWLLHRSKRLEGRRYEEEEVRRLREFERDTVPAIQPLLQQIHEQVRLDYYGIDCHLSEHGTLTPFEINATMNILHNQPSPNRWDAPCRSIRDSLEAVLVEHIRASAPRPGTSAQTTAGAGGIRRESRG